MQALLFWGWLWGMGVLMLGCQSAPPQVAEPAAASDTLATLFEAYEAIGFAPVVRNDKAARAWADSTLAGLTLEEKIGQLFIVHLLERDVERLKRGQQVAAVSEYGVGGFLVSRVLGPNEVLEATQTLQQQSRLPLFFAADYERGVGRFANALTELPANMSLGATRDTLWAAVAGRLTAIESRAIGVNWLFAPVADVNNNPANPIINIRSYGENPEQVGQMAAAFVHQTEAYGVLTTLKHFPGHGNTSVDSHSRMGTISGTYSSFLATEIAPYREVLAAPQPPGAIMTAHLWASAVDAEPLPATFSRNVLTHLLRDTLGFDGIVVTDDVRMGALRNTFSRRERTLRPLLAGADVILTPADLAASIQLVKTAIEQGDLTEARLDQSVRRILMAKARIGLHRKRLVGGEPLTNLLRKPLGEPLAEAIAAEAITAVKTHAVLPLHVQQNIGVVHLTNYRGSTSIAAAMDSLDAALGLGDGAARVDEATTPVARARIRQQMKEKDVIVLALYLRLRSGRGDAGLPAREEAFVRDLIALDVPVVLVTFGNPYAVSTFLDADAHVVGYDQTIATVKAMARVLQGNALPTGRLPITVTPYRFGSGLPSLQ